MQGIAVANKILQHSCLPEEGAIYGSQDNLSTQQI